MRSIRNEIGKGRAKNTLFMRSIRNKVYGTKYTEQSIRNKVYGTKYTERSIRNEVYGTKYTERNIRDETEQSVLKTHTLLNIFQNYPLPNQ